MTPRPDIADHPARVLIVDNERLNRDLLGIMLAPEGHVLLTAASGEEALEIVSRHPPDLILLDVMMPGMDGYQVAGKIKGNPATKNILIIMVTNLDERNDRLLGLKAGAEDFLAKPVDEVELCVRVRNLLRLKAYGDYYDKYSQRLEGEVDSRTADLVERAKTLEQQAAVLTEQAALLDLAPDAIVVRDMQNRILFWSRGAEAMYGCPSAEAVGKDTSALLRAEFSEPAETIQATLLRHGQWEGEAIHHKRDGTRMVVASRWALQRGANGTPVRILTINHDITHSKQADSERFLLTKRLSLATAVAKVGVWEWDLANHTLTWDATMFDLYGFPSVIPMPYGQWSASVHAEDLPAVEATRRQTIAARGRGSSEYRIVRPDGSVRHLSEVHRVVLDEHGNASRMIGVDLDVTERKNAAAALDQVRQDQMRFKDEFLSHVSHELRSPLTAIKQFTTILLNGWAGELNKEQHEYQKIVLRNIDQLQSMIGDLLEVTGLETGKLTVVPESASIADAVTDTFNTLKETARAKGIVLSSVVTSDLPSAYADETRLRQMLIILLDNAIKFTPEGGNVSLRAQLLERDPRFLLVEVSDTGCGIDLDMPERVFERLYQVSERVQLSRKGLGLGLYICKELVTRQGGTLHVKSAPGQGSTFSFTLPVFSLNNVIAPLLHNGKWPGESVALVTVDVCFSDSEPSKETQQESYRDARDVIQRCLLPDLDVLLPRMNADMHGERFSVAAFADDKGASVLANRIGDQFNRLPHPKQKGPILSVSYNILQPLPRVAGASVEAIVSSMASHLEEAIRSPIIPEARHHE